MERLATLSSLLKLVSSPVESVARDAGFVQNVLQDLADKYADCASKKVSYSMDVQWMTQSKEEEVCLYGMHNLLAEYKVLFTRLKTTTADTVHAADVDELASNIKELVCDNVILHKFLRAHVRDYSRQWEKATAADVHLYLFLGLDADAPPAYCALEDTHKSHLLIAAFKKGPPLCVEELLEGNPDVNFADDQGSTPLLAAIQGRKDDVFDRLLQHPDIIVGAALVMAVSRRGLRMEYGHWSYVDSHYVESLLEHHTCDVNKAYTHADYLGERLRPIDMLVLNHKSRYTRDHLLAILRHPHFDFEANLPEASHPALHHMLLAHPCNVELAVLLVCYGASLTSMVTKE